jgi:hypothetical protein
MAEPSTPEPASEPTAGQTAPRSPSSILVRITVLLFVIAIIGAECLLASLCIPSAPESATTPDAAASHEAKPPHSEKEKPGHSEKKKEEGKTGGHGKEGEKKGGKQTPAVEEPEPDAANQVEVDLEQFSVTAHQPTSNTTMRIEFHLFGVVSVGDKPEFERLFKANQHRMRDQVLFIVRSAEGRDLADAGLGLIKRQILEKTNTLLGKPLLRAIIMSEFSYIEQ